MTKSKRTGSGFLNQIPNGITIVGIVFFVILVLVTLSVGLGRPSSVFSKKQAQSTPSLESASSQSIDGAAFPIEITTRESLENIPEEKKDFETPNADLIVDRSESINSDNNPIADLSSQHNSPTPAPSQTPTPIVLQAQPVRPISTLIANQKIEEPKSTPLTELMPTPNGIYSWTVNVPILMYHYISDPPQDADKYRQDLSVSPEDFRKHMVMLIENGFETIDLYDLSLAIVNKRELPAKPIIITLDDGYLDNFTNAYPILRELGLKATFFVVTDFIDQNNPNYMNWAMIEEMTANGMRIEPHSKNHPDLRDRDWEFLIYQILGSIETIEAHTGFRPKYFAYPGGFYDEDVIKVLKELDSWGAVTTAGGRWHGFDDRFEWTRLRMRNTTTELDLKNLIES